MICFLIWSSWTSIKCFMNKEGHVAQIYQELAIVSLARRVWLTWNNCGNISKSEGKWQEMINKKTGIIWAEFCLYKDKNIPARPEMFCWKISLPITSIQISQGAHLAEPFQLKLISKSLVLLQPWTPTAARWRSKCSSSCLLSVSTMRRATAEPWRLWTTTRWQK